MFAEFFKSKWLVVAMFITASTVVASNSATAAGKQGFSLQLQGPQVHTPSSPAKYGPVAKSDTLWSIATKTRPSADLNIYQTMEAILRLNPHAFLDGDMNKVIDGSYLKLPTASMIRATDADYLKQKNSPLSTAKPAPKAPKAAKTPAKELPKKPAIPSVNPSKVKELQGQLADSNEDLLLSSETNRRLKIQLESIRVELSGLKEQMAEENQLKADLKQLIEEQKAQIALLQQEIEAAKKQAELDKDTSMTSWIIIGVASVFVLLLSIWLGLWLKNRNDQQTVEEDSNLFETDNAVDELSEYLATDSYAVEPELQTSPEFEAPAEVNPEAFAVMEEEETLDFNQAMNEGELDFNTEAEITISEPEMPEIVENEIDINESDFSDLDLTLDDETTSFDDDEVTPDLSWRDELNTENDNLDADEESLIPSSAADVSSVAENESNEFEEDLAEIDDMLAQFRDDPVADTASVEETKAPVESAMDEVSDVMDELDIDSLIADTAMTETPVAEEAAPANSLPQAKGQTVDEMLAELDGQIEAEPEQAAVAEPVEESNDAVEEVVEPAAEAMPEATPEVAESVTESSNIDDFDIDDFDIDALMAENNAPVAVESIDDILANNAEDLADALLEQNKLLEEEISFPEPPAAPVAETVEEPVLEIPEPVSEITEPAPAKLEAVTDSAPVNAEPLDDIESMLSEFGENAFSNAPSDQAPIDPVAAQAEEFIDIDKLLNDAGDAPVELADEPYDQVTLDVGLDEFSNSVIDGNDVDIDDDSNRIGAQLDLARAYLEIDDKDGARSILEPLAQQADETQQVEIKQLMARL